MKSAVFCIFALVLGSAVSQNYLNPQRLIQLNENEQKWMGEREIYQLISNGINFMDITDHQELKGDVVKSDVEIPSAPRNQRLVNSLISLIDQRVQRRNLEYYSDFYTRYYRSDTGVAAANWLFELVSGYAGNRSDITVSQFSHNGYDQKSVLARIEGTSGMEDLVVIGAHLDSINVNNPSGGRSPGADDDGSGTMTNVEVFRIISAQGYKPYYTLEFQWYAAEEVGLLGSQDIANYYRDNNQKVAAMFQMDMTAYTPSADSPVRVINDYVDSELTLFTKTLIEEYSGLTWRDHSCGYACSDHASYYRAGFRSSTTFEAQTNPRIHTDEDDMPLVNWDHVLGFTKYSLAFAVEMSSQ